MSDEKDKVKGDEGPEEVKPVQAKTRPNIKPRPPKDEPKEAPKEVARDSGTDSKPAKSESQDEKVVFVDHPLYWPGVGRLNAGFNLVQGNIADKWIEKGWAREASVNEVSEHYGV